MYSGRSGCAAVAASRLYKPDPATSHWLPNLERPTGGYPAAKHPGVIYTAGAAGDNNREILSNEVYWHGG